MHGECKNLHGDKLTSCKLRIIEDSIKTLESHKSKCKESKDPDLCMEKIRLSMIKLSVERERLIKNLGKPDI